ncbi:hypothetical protein R1flu_024599 [Riccia fluitans]|uniref:DNA primase large subunit n=1 Tax=Riccia fluitans TaxID=41844 RepID=A0ABD1XVB7_9MARC
MEYKVAGNKRTSFGDGGDGGGVSSRLSFYQNSSDVDVSLEDFEQFALDRLRVLKAIEEARTRGRKQEDVDTLVIDLWRKHMRTPSAADLAAKDMISHFVLRLAYCRTEDLRRWFLGMETALFRARFRAETPDAQRKFMEDQKLPYKAISAAEFSSVKEKLGQVARSLNQPVPNADNTFYKVPFEEVPELVSARRVYLQRGFAFVPRDQLASIVVGQFRGRLTKALALTNRLWTTTIAAEEKDRLTPIVEALSMRYLGADYSQPSKGYVGIQDLDNLAKKSFPLCMRHLFFNLRHDHHLKFGGRQQLGLFLKGVGLKLEDALNFWRSEFTMKMPVEKFDKEYAYSIRHNFGKEGKRVDYTPYSCMKIITSTPGVGDHHGCPYRHFSQENLRAVLEDQQLNPRAVEAVMDKVRNRHYQLACATTFEAIHGCPSDGINHPNQYFEQSRKALQCDQDEVPEKGQQSGMVQNVSPHPVESTPLPVP